MEGLFLNTVGVSAAVSVVLLPLLILAPRWAKRYAPQTRQWVWLAAGLTLLLLPLMPKHWAPVQLQAPQGSVALPAAVQPILPDAAAPDGTISQSGPAGQEETAFHREGAGESREIPWTALLSGLWLAGVCGVLLAQGGGYLLARRALMKHARPAAERKELTARLCPGRPVRFFLADGLDSPLTLGLIRPAVLLPGEGVPEAAVAHELIHIRRRDVAYKTLLLAACAVHWFNPLVWLMARRAGRDVESACDHLVTAHGDGAYRRAYGELLIHTAAGRPVPFTTQFGGGKALIKARLYDLFHPGKRSRALVGAVLAACLLAGCLVACRSGGETQGESATPADSPDSTLSDGTYCATVPISPFEEKEDYRDYSSITLELMRLDPDSGTTGAALGSHTLPLAEGLELKNLYDDGYTAAGETGTGERTKRLFSFIFWPYLRSDAAPGTVLNWLEVEVSGGEVTRMGWMQTDAPTGKVLEAEGVPDAVVGMAQYWTAVQAAQFIRAGGSCDSYQVDSLELAIQYKDLSGMDLDVYRIEYRLHTTAASAEELPSKLFAGSAYLEEGGWYIPSYYGCHYLVFDVSGGKEPEYLLELLENDCAPGSELFDSDVERELARWQEENNS